jgi:hypothetical protein
MEKLKKIALIAFIIMCGTFTLGKILTLTSTTAEAAVSYSSNPYVTYEIKNINGKIIAVFKYREDIEVIRLN